MVMLMSMLVKSRCDGAIVGAEGWAFHFRDFRTSGRA